MVNLRTSFEQLYNVLAVWHVPIISDGTSNIRVACNSRNMLYGGVSEQVSDVSYSEGVRLDVESELLNSRLEVRVKKRHPVIPTYVGCKLLMQCKHLTSLNM